MEKYVFGVNKRSRCLPTFALTNIFFHVRDNHVSIIWKLLQSIISEFLYSGTVS